MSKQTTNKPITTKIIKNMKGAECLPPMIILWQNL